jgi:hypothetical protein
VPRSLSLTSRQLQLERAHDFRRRRGVQTEGRAYRRGVRFESRGILHERYELLEQSTQGFPVDLFSRGSVLGGSRVPLVARLGNYGPGHAFVRFVATGIRGISHGTHTVRVKRHTNRDPRSSSWRPASRPLRCCTFETQTRVGGRATMRIGELSEVQAQAFQANLLQMRASSSYIHQTMEDTRAQEACTWRWTWGYGIDVARTDTNACASYTRPGTTKCPHEDDTKTQREVPDKRHRPGRRLRSSFFSLQTSFPHAIVLVPPRFACFLSKAIT